MPLHPSGEYVLRVPWGVLVIEWILSILLIGGERFSRRIILTFGQKFSRDVRRVLIAGAGDAGEAVARQLLKEPEKGYTPVCFADDAPEWQGKYNTLESKYNAAKQESKKMSQDIEALTSVIVEQNEADLGGLSEEDKALVLDLAGDDPVAINKMFRKLRSANKIGTSRPMSSKDDTRVASENQQPGRPKSWEEADKRFAARMSSKASK